MPIFRPESSNLPAWSELRNYEAHELGPEGSVAVRREHEREIVVCTYGTGQLVMGAQSLALAEGQFASVPANVHEYTLRGTWRPASFMRLAGEWGNEVAGCGIFRVNPGEGPKNIGDAVDYPKLTGVDRHYHDYDEYWIVLDGSAAVRIGADEFVVRRGDCVATGKGHHHDIAFVHAPFRAVYFEGTLRGQKRIGHLWNHKHGTAVPDPERA